MVERVSPGLTTWKIPWGLRETGALACVAVLTLGAGPVSVATSASVTESVRPDVRPAIKPTFQLPFPCRTQWQLNTYASDHNPAVDIVAIAAEYNESFDFVRADKQPKLVAWLGSNIGNFDPDPAVTFLRGIRGAVTL